MSIKIKFEEILNEFHKENYTFLSDHVDNDRRVVRMKKYTIFVTIIRTNAIFYDIYADLSDGIYEIGDLHLLTRRMLSAKQVCLSYDSIEMNTTERLYPENRRGGKTQTSGL